MIDTSKIRSAREKRGVSQEHMAERLHISQSTYARMESGKQKIEAGQLFQIAEELQEPISHFLDEHLVSVQYGNHTFNDNAAFNKNYYNVQKELYDEHLQLLRDEIAELRKERNDLLDLLKTRLS